MLEPPPQWRGLLSFPIGFLRVWWWCYRRLRRRFFAIAILMLRRAAAICLRVAMRSPPSACSAELVVEPFFERGPAGGSGVGAELLGDAFEAAAVVAD